MMNEITRPQAEALAELVHTLRPEWDPQGILAALAKARDRADAPTVAIAAIRAAATPTNRTPAVIPLSGDHWIDPAVTPSSTGAVPRPTDRRCTEPGHEHYSLPCKGCRAEQLARTDDTLPVSPITHLTPEQADVNRRGSRAVIAALNANRTSAREDTP